ncbi:hypothetical protein CASFOL_026747 [Castilleja foliolosa]|uniref:Uncharacterized protein n=1 Tax=Castilleja foliolosa TaxID=1961234 RepID=A0ABD3CHY6_9LAMI
MASLPRILLSLSNTGILIAGAYYIISAKDVSMTSSINPCLRQTESSIRWAGIISSALAAIGIICVCLKLKALQCFYLFALVISTGTIVIFCMFVSAMMPWQSADEIFYGTAENGTWLPNYGAVMQKTVANGRDWSAAKDCFREIETCLTMRNQTQEQKVVLIDFGCCSPPNRCGLEQARGGIWVVPQHGLNKTDEECLMWASVGKNCFECDSCKAGYLANYQKTWDNNTPSRIKCIAFLIATLALTYHTFMHDHYKLEDNKDSMPKKLILHTRGNIGSICQKIEIFNLIFTPKDNCSELWAL